jgi:hypothetical protein
LLTAGPIASLVCFFFFLAVYGITSRGKLQASDEAAVFASGISLATRGHLAIDDFAWLQERVNIGSTGPDGHLYTKYFPGNVFAVALVYKLTARSNDSPYIWVKEVAPSVTGARWALRLNALWGAVGMTFLLALLRPSVPGRPRSPLCCWSGCAQTGGTNRAVCIRKSAEARF